MALKGPSTRDQNSKCLTTNDTIDTRPKDRTIKRGLRTYIENGAQVDPGVEHFPDKCMIVRTETFTPSESFQPVSLSREPMRLSFDGNVQLILRED